MSKEPWQMTREEFVSAKLPSYEWFKKFGWPEGYEYNKSLEYRRATGHAVILVTAYHQHKPIPVRVLADYPDLLKGRCRAELKAKAGPKAKRERLIDKVMNEVIWYGGLPMRYGDVMRDLEATAKSTGEKNWLPIREAGMMGVIQFNRSHPMPEGTEPVSYAEFQALRRQVDEGAVAVPAKTRTLVRRVKSRKAGSKCRQSGISLKAVRI